MTDYSLDQIGKRLGGEGLTEHERLLAEDDKVRVAWVMGKLEAERWSPDDFPCHRDALDIGASDGWFTAQMVRWGWHVWAVERHPAHVASLTQIRPTPWLFLGDVEKCPFPKVDVALCCEVLEHMDAARVKDLLYKIRARTLIVTVPNANCKSYLATGRARRDWPDHRLEFRADSLAERLACVSKDFSIEPIVGTLDDSIWLGAVCRRQ